VLDKILYVGVCVRSISLCKLNIWLVLLGIFFLSTSSHAVTCDETPILKYFDAGGEERPFYIKQERFEKIEAWSPAVDDLPFTIKELVNLFEDWGSKNVKGADRVVINGINLSKYHCIDLPSRWYFLVMYVPVVNEKKTFVNASYAVVLFDKSIIAPGVDGK